MLGYLTCADAEHLDVILTGDLDIDSTEVIEEELMHLLEKYKKTNLNFENVPFVDSSGIGLLMNLVQTLNKEGTKVTISHVREEVYDVFDILQLPEILGEDVFI